MAAKTKDELIEGLCDLILELNHIMELASSDGVLLEEALEELESQSGTVDTLLGREG